MSSGTGQTSPANEGHMPLLTMQCRIELQIRNNKTTITMTVVHPDIKSTYYFVGKSFQAHRSYS